MRTTAVLVILLLAVGLNLGASMALAEDHAVIQPLPSACQPVSDVELSQMRGKFLGWGAHDVSHRFTEFITHDTIVFRQQVPVEDALVNANKVIDWLRETNPGTYKYILYDFGRIYGSGH